MYIVHVEKGDWQSIFILIRIDLSIMNMCIIKKRKLKTVIVNNSANINKTNNRLSRWLTEHEKDN